MSLVHFVGIALAFLQGGQSEGTQAVVQAQGVVRPTWKGTQVQDLHEEYYNIFKHGNRNAASHLWSSFLLDRSQDLSPETFVHLFSGFCAVSGSPVTPHDGKRYRLNLDTVWGSKRRGYMYHCCWPCVCDTQDFIKVDTKSVTTSDGVTRQYHVAVLGNPCERPEELSKPFEQSFGRGTTTLQHDAPEVRCGAKGELLGAHLSDHGYIIVSMFFDEQPELSSMDESEFQGECEKRKANGYDSGMGQIFRKVAAISPINVTHPVPANYQQTAPEPAQLPAPSSASKVGAALASVLMVCTFA